ncbi:MAG: DinB family protein [Phycisphaerales bacterium]|nr:DinB family protein [Phycisphaerales bacterium]
MDPETLAQAVEYTENLFVRFLAGFDEGNKACQETNLPNHAAWLLGHCALSMHRVAGVIDGGSVPEEDFVSMPETPDTARYDIESIAKDSEPAADPSLYPLLDRGKAIFHMAIVRLAAAVRAASSSDLGEKMSWHGTPLSRGELVLRICFHNGCHAGQLVDMRRALSMPAVIPS